MRKETSAGIIAGLVSGLPLGAISGGEAAWTAWTMEGSVRTPITNMTLTQMSYTDSLISALFPFVIVLSLFVCVGILVGFIFAVAVNKLPIRSTYAKAIIISLILWLVFTIPSLPATYYAPSFLPHFEWSWSSLPYLPLFVLDGLVFAFLFNRWSK
ncbi:MAG: hypothetical protein WB643_10325 [Candidatus Bathyarchaeia archaeon]